VHLSLSLTLTSFVDICILLNLTWDFADWQFLFKKYLDYEKSQGDKERIESVKRKALEYIENMP
jgi:hypothetical protein